jgi:tetratricopeptide (TPR) repeat protein
LDSALVQPALESFDQHFPAPSETAARARRSLGEIAFDFGLHSKAAEQLALAVEMWTALPERDAAALCETINRLGQAHLRAGDADAAARAFARAQELGESSLGELHPQTIAAVGYAAYPLKRWGRLQESAAQVREAIHRMRRANSTSARLHALELNLAQSLRQLRELEEAEALLRAAVEGLSRAVGPESLDALGAMSSLSMVLLDRGRAAEAAHWARRAADGFALASGRESSAALSASLTHARALHALGRCDESLSETAAVLASYRRILPAGHEHILAAEYGLALTLAALERFEEAHPLLVRQHLALRERFGPGHPEALKASASLADFLVRLEQSALALDLLDEALENAAGSPAADSLEVLHLEQLWVSAALQLGRIDEARERAERALEHATPRLGAEHHLCGSLRFLLRAALERDALPPRAPHDG